MDFEIFFTNGTVLEVTGTVNDARSTSDVMYLVGSDDEVFCVMSQNVDYIRVTNIEEG